jgi:O-antigen chain-terminating methyltransferase
VSASAADDYSAFYAAFSERFRSSFDDVKQRLSVHARFLAAAGGPPGPVVDLGVGRGEWIELATASGWKAIGVDNNADIIAASRKRGFEIVESDAMEYLERTATGSLGAVTGFHIIEHLTPSDKLRLIRSAYRALAPGGWLILEWPNIGHPRVAQYTFWLDPTHGPPLPGELAAFMAEYAGFTDIQLVRLDAGKPVGFEALDIALIARKPQG